jgi:hypothetical protein
MWQEIAGKINTKFDVLLNTDNSLVYMDGWSETGSVSVGFDAISKRLALVLKNFFDLLNDDGFVVIGLGKHYDPILSDEYWKQSNHKIFHASKNNHAIQIECHIETDWQKNRILDWTLVADGDEVTGSTRKKAYLVTKYELADIMRSVGFEKVHIFEPDGTRDNLIIGMKSDRFKL